MAKLYVTKYFFWNKLDKIKEVWYNYIITMRKENKMEYYEMDIEGYYEEFYG